MKNLTRALLPLFVLGACGGSEEKKEDEAAVEEGIELVHKSVKGETYSIEMSWDEKISSTDPTGKTQLNEIKMENVMDYVVQDVDQNGTATIMGKYASMKMGDFDSKDSATYKSEMGMMYRMMASKEIVMKVDNKGRVLDFKGADGLYSMGVPDSPLNDNEIMRENVQGTLNIFPDKKVKKGDSWKKTHTISFGYPCIYHNTYTLKDVKDGIATIEVSSEMEPNMDAKPTYFPGGVELQQELQGTQTGTIEVDVEKGKILGTDFELKINGKAKGKMGGQPLEIVMSTELHIKTKVNFGAK